MTRGGALKLFNSADVLVLGVRDLPHRYYKRLLKEKLVYIFSERPYKKMNRKNFIHFLIGSFIHHKIYQKYYPWLLSVGYYTYGDYIRFGNYKKRSLRFCYYPNEIPYDANLISKKQSSDFVSMLVVGGMYGNKNHALAFKAVEHLNSLGIENKLFLVGDGKDRPNLEKIVKDNKLENQIIFLGNLPFEETNKWLQNSMIYIVPTGKLEGFNVTTLMAMNSGCLCVSNIDSGATKQLLSNKRNGLIFKDEKEFLEAIEYAALEKNKRIEMAKIAKDDYETMWSKAVAAERFSLIIKELLQNKKKTKTKFESGSLSLITK